MLQPPPTQLREKKSTASESSFLGLRLLVAVLICASMGWLVMAGTSHGKAASLHSEAPANASHRALTLAERVSYQRAIEEVYWRHRIWPKERPDPKLSFDDAISQAQLEKKVKSYLRNSEALEDDWQRAITAEQLQAEMDRMAQNTRQPEVLRELFEALGNDPFVIAECLARPVLAERLLEQPAVERVKQQSQTFHQTVPAGCDYTLPAISGPSVGCVGDTWTPTNLTSAPDTRVSHTAVWTGSEMIVWGGSDDITGVLNTGGRYNPSTDSWTTTSTTNAPEARVYHTAVWTGSQMIVWGGDNGTYFNTGGRYNPITNSWTATSTTNAPDARSFHTAVWTGSEMIVWGGGAGIPLNTGGRYNPSTNSWIATSTANAPSARSAHTAVWTGTQMIVWGGSDANGTSNRGGRYNPGTNSWTATSTANAPERREFPTAVWTGSEMIVWGGERANTVPLNTGGRYKPGTNSWTATSIGNAPDARSQHTSIWTGNNMIVWGGIRNVPFNNGGRYYPDIDLWVSTSTNNAPSARFSHTAVWTGSEMVVWGGANTTDLLNSGGKYCVPSGQPTPTPVPTPCPGGFAVCNGNDSGPGSLRQAILDASPGDTITFAPSVTTVTLINGELVINKNLVITGPGANRLTVTARCIDFACFRIFNVRPGVTVSISGMTISNGFDNQGPGGGGILSAGVLTLTDCTISDNNTSTSFGGILGGGGVMNDHGTMTITGCTISNNSADQYGSTITFKGGGILNESGSLIITNSTISDNSCSSFFPEPFQAVAVGGGISNSGDLRITSSTIAHNSAAGNQAFSGGIYGAGPTRTDSSIIALNSAPVGPDFAGVVALQSTGYNIVGNNAGAVINSRSTDQIGTPAAPINPLLRPLADYGGPTLTHALQPGSPAINRGDPAAPSRDQRGYGRLGVPDVGAFEFHGIPPTPTPTATPTPRPPTPTPTATPATTPSHLGNISSRSLVQTGDNVMIGGFIVEGSQPKRVIVRAIGPELSQFGVPDSLANPRLELHNNTGALIASNDNWQFTIIGGVITGDQRAEIRQSGHAPTDPRESAIIADLPPGNYTAIVRGVNNTTGVGLVEVYDLSGASSSILGNISTRSFVQTGDNVMIGGFIVEGTQPKRVILRAIGPELGQFGVPVPLVDPTLELHNRTGALIASNDNWQHTIIGGIITSDQRGEIRNSGHAPTDGRESAIIAELPAGNYTAIVRGVNNTTGVGLVEVYDLD